MPGAARKFQLLKEQVGQVDGPADEPAGELPGDPARDPARDAPQKPSAPTDMVRNLDIPASAFSSDNATSQARLLAKRPGYNTSGKEVTLNINCFPVKRFPTKPIYQYDVSIGNGAEERIVNQKVWGARAVKAKYPKFIYDGSRLAWSLNNIPNESSLVVDLDEEQGRRGQSSNTFKITVKPTKVVNLQAVLEFATNNNTSLLLDMLEGLNALDHVLRETPSTKFIAIRRSFFSVDNAKMDLGGGAMAYKGIYQALRVVHPGRLTLSVDVSNSCFWGMNSLTVLATSILRLRDIQELIAKTQAHQDQGDARSPTKYFGLLGRLNKLVVKANYKGCPCPDKEWKIKNLILANAKEYRIEITDKATGGKEMLSIYDYFKTRYNVTLDYWQLPLVQMTKRGVIYPMEVLAVYSPQRYPYKLDEMQTATMIKFAVTRPPERFDAIMRSKAALDHGADPVLKAYGMEISDTMQKTKGRLLQNPSVCFGGNQKTNPGTTGRWDLRGKKFFAPNNEPLDSWAVGFFRGSKTPSRQQIGAFIGAFTKQYTAHGGKITNKNPLVAELAPDAGKAAYELYHNTGNKFNKRPQLLIFIVNGRESNHYQRIKKSCDCRFGVSSQVVQAMHVQKCAPQYVSNVLSKVNAKLGGVTAVSNGTANIRPYTMIIGADVSHAAPGMLTPSTAAMTVSMDRVGGQYAGVAQTNGRRVEMITEDNVENMLAPIVKKWAKDVGQGRPPQYIYYFRDGVSEGQFQQVLETEVQYIRKVLRHANNGNPWNGKITVIVASKRHHIRGFPEASDRNAADKNKNCVPGVIVERDVTDPHGFDFFLWSHTALQGTSRPVHYHVLLDEQGHPPHILENLIYEHCYQYVRSTTSVSIYPAIYYAHLVSNRARCHENVPSSSGPKEGAPSVATADQVQSLLPIHASTSLPFRMWYI